MTTGGNLDEETRLGKRMRARSLKDEGSEVANLGTESQGSYDICGKSGGTHGFAYHKFKC